MIENKQLKLSLILQSFAPLFLLILVQHFRCGFFRAICRFWNLAPVDINAAFYQVISYNYLGDFVVSVICVVWVGGAFAVWFGFKGFESVNFGSHGEKINIDEDIQDVGASYFVTFILPLMADDVSTIRGFAVFVLLLSILLLLITRSNLFYQNPVLAVLNYKVFRFTFLNPYCDIQWTNKSYIGLTKGAIIKTDSIIKRKYIADNVFLISKN